MSSAGGAPGAGAGAAVARPAAGVGMKYVCGSCGSLNTLAPRDQVRCRACGYRIFYKVRTERREYPRLGAPCVEQGG